jgi:hypothetical protein
VCEGVSGDIAVHVHSPASVLSQVEESYSGQASVVQQSWDAVMDRYSW